MTVVDATGELTIDSIVGYAIYTNAAITLLNLTTNTVLWDTGWEPNDDLDDHELRDPEPGFLLIKVAQLAEGLGNEQFTAEMVIVKAELLFTPIPLGL